MSNSLGPHGLQHTRLPCASPTPGAYSNACPSSQWCHPTISSSVVPFSSCLQFFQPASVSFPMSQFFISGGQSIGISASASVLPLNIQDWFPLGWTGWLSLQSKGLLKVFSNTTVQKYQFFGTQLSFGEGYGTPLQYSCLENPMDGGAWWAAAHGVAKSRTWLRDFPFTFHFHALEKEMATHSSVLAWRIPGMVEPGGLPSMGLHRVRHDWSDLVAAFFRVQLSHPYMTTGKTIALTRQTFVSKVMSLLFNMLFRNTN